MKTIYKRLILVGIVLAVLLTAALMNDNFLIINNGEQTSAPTKLSDVGLAGKSVRSTSFFDSEVVVNLYYDEALGDFESIDAEILDIWKTVHQLGTRWDDEDVINIKTINENPGVWHTVDPLLFDMIETSIEYHDITNGYFDITMGPVIDVWDHYREKCEFWEISLRGVENSHEIYERDQDIYCRLPDDEDLLEAAQYVGINNIQLNHDSHQIKIEEGMILDLGGIAKGYAAKLVGDHLKADPRIEHFLINAGSSNLEVYGEHPLRESGEWYTGLIDPVNINNFTEERRFASAILNDGDNATTSGDYVRYYMVDGQRYHHIIDPFTLYPTDYQRSVTLISSDGSIGDILVTAIFMMPTDEGLAFVNNLDNMEAIWFVDEDTYPPMSDGFEEKHLRMLYRDFNQEDSQLAVIITLGVLAILAMGSGLGYTLYIKQKNNEQTPSE